MVSKQTEMETHIRTRGRWKRYGLQRKSTTARHARLRNVVRTGRRARSSAVRRRRRRNVPGRYREACCGPNGNRIYHYGYDALSGWPIVRGLARGMAEGEVDRGLHKTSVTYSWADKDRRARDDLWSSLVNRRQYRCVGIIVTRFVAIDRDRHRFWSIRRANRVRSRSFKLWNLPNETYTIWWRRA